MAISSTYFRPGHSTPWRIANLVAHLLVLSSLSALSFYALHRLSSLDLLTSEGCATAGAAGAAQRSLKARDTKRPRTRGDSDPSLWSFFPLLFRVLGVDQYLYFVSDMSVFSAPSTLLNYLRKSLDGRPAHFSMEDGRCSAGFSTLKNLPISAIRKEENLYYALVGWALVPTFVVVAYFNWLSKEFAKYS